MWFFLFVTSVAFNCTFTIYFACYCVAIDGFDMLYVLGLLESLVFCGFGWILTCTSVITIYLNLFLQSRWLTENISRSVIILFLDFARLHESDDQRDVQLQEIPVLKGQKREIL